jgi:hypothetical protein
MNEIKGTIIELSESFCEIANYEFAVRRHVGWLHGAEIHSCDSGSWILVGYFECPATWTLAFYNSKPPNI